MDQLQNSDLGEKSVSEMTSPLIESIMRNGDNIRLDRAQDFSESMRNASLRLCLQIKEKISDIELEKRRILDFSPRTTDDLTVGLTAGKASNIVSHVLELNVQLISLNEELNSAVSQHKAWFGTSPL